MGSVITGAEVEARLVDLLRARGEGRDALLSAAIVYEANAQPIEAVWFLERANELSPISNLQAAAIARAAGRCDLERRWTLRVLANPPTCYSSRDPALN